MTIALSIISNNQPSKYTGVKGELPRKLKKPPRNKKLRERLFLEEYKKSPPGYFPWLYKHHAVAAMNLVFLLQLSSRNSENEFPTCHPSQGDKKSRDQLQMQTRRLNWCYICLTFDSTTDSTSQCHACCIYAAARKHQSSRAIVRHSTICAIRNRRCFTCLRTTAQRSTYARETVSITVSAKSGVSVLCILVLS